MFERVNPFKKKPICILFGLIILLFIACNADNQKKDNLVSQDALATSNHNDNVVERLNGEWVFIESYKFKVTDISNLKKTPMESKYGRIIMTFKKDGHYISDQGDYTDVGKFTVDSNNLINKFDHKGDTSIFQIIYLDEQFLLIVNMDKDPYSYFYKRK